MFKINHKIKIKGTNEYLLSKHKEGRKTYWLTSCGNKIYSQELFDLECQCVSCKEYFDVRLNYNLLHRKKYECYSCQRSGERNNFYGKKHSKKSKKKMSESTNHSGENNPFYKKSHTTETKAQISKWMAGRYKGEKNHFYGKTHTAKTRSILSKKSREYALQNLDKMREMGIKSVQNSSKGRKTKPERLTEQKLQKMGIEFKYNKIIKSVGQFDFIINDSILLEVNGDYWHGNPKFYGEGKRKISERQEYKIQRDEEKKLAVENMGYKIFYIWEDDINNGNWAVLEEIKNELNKLRISRNR